jgi:hypothetical protein
MYSAGHKKERQREADRRYRLRHPDRCRERDRKWREANPAKRKAQKRRNYLRHRAEILAKKHRHYVEAGVWTARRLLFALDAAAYAKYRASARMRVAKRCVLAGRFYKPRFARRIPDWCVWGGGVDVRSQWLVENLTPSQRDYAMQLAIERKEWRNR